MSRYGREFQGGGRSRGYDADTRGRGQGMQDAPRGQRGGSRYGSDFRTFDRGGPLPGRRLGWGMETGSELTGGYSDYSPRGRFGGYYGAWDTRPLGSRADLEREQRRRSRR
jgi:hypothetical protein